MERKLKRPGGEGSLWQWFERKSWKAGVRRPAEEKTPEWGRSSRWGLAGPRWPAEQAGFSGSAGKQQQLRRAGAQVLWTPKQQARRPFPYLHFPGSVFQVYSESEGPEYWRALQSNMEAVFSQANPTQKFLGPAFPTERCGEPAQATAQRQWQRKSIARSTDVPGSRLS